jgi:hypothetical protein
VTKERREHYFWSAERLAKQFSTDVLPSKAFDLIGMEKEISQKVS